MEAPIEVQNTTPQFSESEARGRLNRIDPRLTYLTDVFRTKVRRDLSDPEELVKRQEKLRPEDLVCVHLTDTFPEGGIIHPTADHDPNSFLRYTVHFSLNGTVGVNFLANMGAPVSWGKKAYAVIVPFKPLLETDRVLNFTPTDTFVLDSVILPQGSFIIKDKKDPTDVSNAGQAKVIETNYPAIIKRNELTGVEKAVYEVLVREGYFPQILTTYSWLGWDNFTGEKVLTEFAEDHDLPVMLHSSNWTANLEDAGIGLDFALERKDPEDYKDFRDSLLAYSRDPRLTERIRQAVADFIKDREQMWEAGLAAEEVPKLIRNTAVLRRREQVAGEKVMPDLKETTEPLIHITTVLSLPLVLREGILSRRFSERTFEATISPAKGFSGRSIQQDLARVKGEDYGLNLISVFFPRHPGEFQWLRPAIDFYKQYVRDSLTADLPWPAGILISPQVTQGTKLMLEVPINIKNEEYGRWEDAKEESPFFPELKRRDPQPSLEKPYPNPLFSMEPILLNEAFIWRRIPARFLTGVVIQEDILNQPLNDLYQECLNSKTAMGYVIAAANYDWGLHSVKSLVEARSHSLAFLQNYEKDLATFLGIPPQPPGVLSLLLDLRHPTTKFHGVTIENEWMLEQGREILEELKRALASSAVDESETVRQVLFKDVRLPGDNSIHLGIPAKNLLSSLEGRLGTREEILENQKFLVETFLRELSGKREIAEATMGDFLKGVCLVSEVPLYNQGGECLWPPN